jgi:hypothetical protein
MLPQGGCKSMFLLISNASSIGLRLLSEREDVQGLKTNKYFGKDACSPGKRTFPSLIYRYPNLTNNV